MAMPEQADALPGRDKAMQISGLHALNGRPMVEPFPHDCETILFGMGCFWNDC